MTSPGPKHIVLLTLDHMSRVHSDWGTQIPLFTGKNICSCWYLGIKRLSKSMRYTELAYGDARSGGGQSGVSSGLQGVCGKKQSCLHNALLLQETMSDALDRHKKIFVSYFDVSKAFD